MNTMRRRAGAAVAILVIVVVVGLWLQPATAYSGTANHLWTTFIRPKADARYLQNTRVYVSSQFTLGALADATVTELCPDGWQALGGGVDFDTANANVQVISSAPVVNGTNLFAADEGKDPAGEGWRVTLHNNGVLTVTGAVAAICSR
jgi:hypothetical protein